MLTNKHTIKNLEEYLKELPKAVENFDDIGGDVRENDLNEMDNAITEFNLAEK
jgi:hypothetical protein